MDDMIKCTGYLACVGKCKRQDNDAKSILWQFVRRVLNIEDCKFYKGKDAQNNCMEDGGSRKGI
jgi:hypothetical protein